MQIEFKFPQRAKVVAARTTVRTLRSAEQSLIRKGHCYNPSTLQCKLPYKGKRLERNEKCEIPPTSGHIQYSTED